MGRYRKFGIPAQDLPISSDDVATMLRQVASDGVDLQVSLLHTHGAEFPPLLLKLKSFLESFIKITDKYNRLIGTVKAKNLHQARLATATRQKGVWKHRRDHMALMSGSHPAGIAKPLGIFIFDAQLALTSGGGIATQCFRCQVNPSADDFDPARPAVFDLNMECHSGLKANLLKFELQMNEKI